MRRTYFCFEDAMSYVITRYTIKSTKVKEPLTVVLAADLHNADTGNDNTDLLADIRNEKPDMIIAAGDMIVGSHIVPYERGLHFMQALSQTAPCFYANGNHERRLKKLEKQGKTVYSKYIEGLRKSGVVILNNESKEFSIRDTDMRIFGVDLPLRLYKKFTKPHLFPESMDHNLGKTDSNRLNILIAHDPEFIDTYFSWGADLVFSGHYHGGLVRSPFSGRALLSPYGYILPKYGVGHYENEGRHAFVSAGLGDHAIPIRIFDPHELVVVKILPE